jgi:hypothetical protein
MCQVRSYFGLKIAFYFGFLGFYTNQLLAPAAAGVFAFLLEFVPSRYESDVKDSSEDAARFDDQYDHPLLFVYGAFLCVWVAYMVQVRQLALSNMHGFFGREGIRVGDELAAISRRPPNPSHGTVVRTEGCTFVSSIVQGPFLCRALPKPNRPNSTGKSLLPNECHNCWCGRCLCMP